MSYDEETALRIRGFLCKEPDVIERKMFGGLCFLVNGHMCCGLTSTAFMVRVGPEQYQEALAQPHARAMDFTGRPLAGMVYVDPAGYKTDAALGTWVRRGLGFVGGLPKKPAGRKAARKTPARKKTTRRK
jgi:TfoX/Sxy family transcriptional regulator of competence genes